MTKTPKGEEYLPEYTEQELIDLYRKEEDQKAKIRLLAAVLRKEGMTLQEIADKIKHPLTTVGDWLRRMHLEGISRRYNTKQPGKRSRLTDDQIAELKSMLSQSPQKLGIPFAFWTTKLVRDFIEREYGISYKVRQVRNILHKLNMSCQKPRPKHRRADEKLQEDFKKTSLETSNRTSKMDIRSCYWMRASFR